MSGIERIIAGSTITNERIFMKITSTIFRTLFISAVVIVIGINHAQAQTSAGDFGIGVIIGEPTGLSAKYYTGGNNAFDFGLAWSFGRHANFHAHADYLIHRFDLIDVNSGQMPLYFGLGGRVRTGHNSQVGIRIPVGVSYYFPNDPLEIFFEVVPILDLTPGTQFSGNGGMGLRYYFNK